MSPAVIGFLRAITVAIIMAVVSFLANAANLNGVVSGGLATLIAAVALAVEHSMAAGTTTALFGAVSTRWTQ
jgi:hypothetical protein